MKHPFTIEDIEVAAKRLGVEFDSVRRAGEELWRSAVARGAVERRAVIIDKHFFKSDEDSGWYDAAIIKLEKS
jgi:hypothetical protein